MEWYFNEKIDDLFIADNPDVFEATKIEVGPSQDDWCHWGITRSEDMGSRNECYVTAGIPSVEDSTFNRQNLYVQVCNKSANYQCNGSSSVDTCGQSSLMDCSVKNSKPSLSDQPDFKLENDTETMDDIFINSFLEDDQIFPDSMYRSMPLEDLPSNMSEDIQNWLDSSRRENLASINSCNFPLFVDHKLGDYDKAEDRSPSCLRSDEERSSPAEEVPCTTNQSDAVSDADEPKCFEATVLSELENVMLQLTEKTRICFRDALYRLAKNSEEQHNVCQRRSASDSNEPIIGQTLGERSRNGRPEFVESNTNAIDRTVANLMYYQSCCDLPKVQFA